MFSEPVIPPVDFCDAEELLGCFASGVPTEAYADAAHRGHLRCLKILREEGHAWNKRCCVYAAAGGHLSCLKYAHQQGCSWEQTCAGAARTGHLTCLRYAHEHGCWWDEMTCEMAAATGHLECLQYAHEQGCPWVTATICEFAVRGRHLDCLLYCYQNGGKLCLPSMHGSTSHPTSTGQSRVKLPPMSLADIARADEMFVQVLVASIFDSIRQTLAAEAIQMAWRKRFYSPDSVFVSRLKKEFYCKKGTMQSNMMSW